MSEGIFDPKVQLNEMMEVVSESNLTENDISAIGDVFDGFNITHIEENKEYVLIGFLILCLIGYYTYTNILQMNTSLNNNIDDTINIEDETKSKETTKEKKD